MPHDRNADSAHRRLTVLQVLPALESGGTERGVLEVAKALVAAGNRSLVISAGGRMVAELTGQGSEHFTRRLGTKSPLTSCHIPWLRRFLQEQNVDVVDMHSRMPAWIAFAAWKSLPRSRRPALISTVHGLHSVSYYSSIMCRGEHVVAVSDSVAEYIRRYYPFVPGDRLHVIHRGIDGAEFPRGFQASEDWKVAFYDRFPQTADKQLLTLIGRITRLKGHEDFLKLLARLRDRRIMVHGLIVGDADPRKAAYLSEIKSLAAALNLNNHVTFTGLRPDVQEIYAISSIVLSLASTPESFGRTVAEALSIGTPVVGYNHGGVAEILAAQFPSGTVETSNLDALENKVAEILALRPRPTPGSNAFEKCSMLRRTLDLYESACRSSQDARNRRI